MPRHPLAAGALAVVASAGAAHAGLMLTFADPTAVSEFVYTAGGAKSDGSIVYQPLKSPPVLLRIDGSDHGMPIINRSVTVFLQLSVGTATKILPGFGYAPTTGSLQFIDNMTSQIIISGAVNNGRLIWSGSTGAELGNSDEGSLFWTQGAFLTTYFMGSGLSLNGLGGFSFALDDILPSGRSGSPVLTINQFGYVESFVSDAAFVASAHVAPSPGPLVLGALGLTLAARRRRA